MVSPMDRMEARLMNEIIENPYINVSVEYRSRVLQAFQDVEAPMFKRVYQPVWCDNTLYASVRRPYRAVLFDEGRLEFNMPLAPSLDWNMEYHRVGVKVLTRVSDEEVGRAVAEMLQPLTKPAGRVKSFTLFIIAPRGCQPIVRGRRLGRDGFLYVIVDPVPERAVVRAFKLFLNHLVKRLKGFVRALRLEEWMVDEYFKYREQSLLNNLIEKYRLSIRKIFEGFVKTVDWIAGHVQGLEKRLMAEKTLFEKIKPLHRMVRELTDMLRYLPADRRPLWAGSLVRLGEDIHAELILSLTRVV